MSDVAIQRLRNEVRLSEENENSGFGQDILLVCNLCERLTDEVGRKESLLREVHDWQHKWKDTYPRIESAVQDLGLIIARIGDELTAADTRGTTNPVESSSSLVDGADDKQAEQLPFPVCKHGVSLVHLVRCLKCDPADKGQCEHQYECVYEGAESETYQCKHCGDRYKLYDDEMR